ncbi:hypothetical protein LJ753_06025 [Arthrobacter sp. zg-Y20]|uniref:DUF6731 family protein n=1 Tax=unclassified Arthrobacter TaxID=235627 RepID=UPI001D13E17E|nr:MULTISPECIES: DUF6731 family protein [unclassified Arthrobacter]MCC3275426.1 hypothetical protein [Arthrobacter sp. zg-Y20]MDK1315583.1 hypothetical protein [Arthrobacter sp. zg.Y20]WIB05998.1 hypothetical protein QNO06_16000 [Arthrobacter sp. zg-Y20]
MVSDICAEARLGVIRVAGDLKHVKQRERTIGFYEIVEVDPKGNTVRMNHVDWSRTLAALDGTKLGDRVFEGRNRTLIGETISHNGELHLKMMRVRDESAWISVYRPSADSVEDLDLNDSALLETSIVSFLNFGNIIGLIQGSPSAPSPTAVAEWINGIDLLTKKIEVLPIVSEDTSRKLSLSSETSRIETRIHTSKADALESHGSKLSGVLRTIRQQYGPMTVTVILQASRAKAQSEGRHMLREEAGTLLDAAAGADVQSAKAKLIYLDADEEATTEEVNFVNQKITAKRKIATLSEDGSPIRNGSAVDAILSAAADHDDELRRIVGG